MHIGLHVKYSLRFSDFNETWIFSKVFSKNTQISNFMNIRAVGGELFHTDGRTDMTKLTVAFRNFANLPKKKQDDWGGRVSRANPVFLHSITYITGQVARILEHPNRVAMVIIHVGLANYCNPPLIQGRENIRAPSHFPHKARPRAICNYSLPHHTARKYSSIY